MGTMNTTTAPGLNEREAFAGIVFAATAADGHIADHELRYLNTIFSRMQLFHAWTPEKFRTLFDKLGFILKTQGLEHLLNISIQTLPAKFFQTAFAVAVDIVLADGIVTSEEKDFLYDLQKKLSIENELAIKIMEVIIIKNRG